MNILAIDLGKFNSMCCFFDTKTQDYSFLNAATTQSYLTTVLTTHEIDLVVMEACGPSGWISDLCQRQETFPDTFSDRAYESNRLACVAWIGSLSSGLTNKGNSKRRTTRNMT